MALVNIILTYESTINKTQDALYIDFAKGAYDKSKKISDSIVVDVAEDGTMIGIEILDATENIKFFDISNLGVQLQVS